MQRDTIMMSHGKKVIVVANRLPLTVNIITPSPTPSATPPATPSATPSAGALAPAEGGTGGKGMESVRPEPLPPAEGSAGGSAEGYTFTVTPSSGGLVSALKGVTSLDSM